MKRVYLSIFVLFLCLSVIPANSAEILLNDPGTYIIGTEDTAVVELISQPSTGNTWKVSSLNLKVFDREFLPDDNLLGGFGLDRITLVSTTDGNGSLVFSLLSRDGDLLETVEYLIVTEGPTTIEKVKTLNTPIKRRVAPLLKNLSLPSSFFVCNSSTCPPVTNQGTCGSCWAHAIVGMLEIQYSVKDNMSYFLSEQFLMNCNDYGYDCNGGHFFAHDLHIDFIPNGGITAGGVLEVNEPYVGYLGFCDAPYSKTPKADGWDWVMTGGSAGGPSVWPYASEIKEAMVEHGPIGVGIYVDSTFTNYTGGIYHGVGNYLPNHAVILVGYVDDSSIPEGGYYILRNSWGPSWGENGYMRIAYDANTVGLGANYLIYSLNPTPDPEPEPDGGGGDSGSGCFINTLIF